MPIRTRSDMHIGLDLALEMLDATPMNRMDAPIKDYFLNRTISEFVKNVINKANAPDEDKRVPFRILTHGDILNKYNDIYTLIKFSDTLFPQTPTDNNIHLYTLPSDLFRFEASFCNVRPKDCFTNFHTGKQTTVASIGSGLGIGTYHYFTTFVTNGVETYPIIENVSNALTVDNISEGVDITNIPIGPTGTTARKIYRTVVNGNWYNAKLLTTISDNVTHTYIDSKIDGDLGDAYPFTSDSQLPNLILNTYDLTAFNNNPYGGKAKYIATALEQNGLRVYHNNRYVITRFGMIYVKKPAVLTSSPQVVNCDLPESVHDRIVDDTAKFIAATATAGNYQQLLMEAKENKS